MLTRFALLAQTTVSPGTPSEHAISWTIGVIVGVVTIIAAIFSMLKLHVRDQERRPKIRHDTEQWREALKAEHVFCDGQHTQLHAMLADHRRELELLRSQLDNAELVSATNREAAAREAGTITEAISQVRHALDRLERRIDMIKETR